MPEKRFDLQALFDGGDFPITDLEWIRHPKGILADGRKVTVELFRQIEAEELGKIKQAIGEEQYGSRKFDKAAQLLDNIITEERFVEFLTLPAYQYLP
jgi:malate synthase